MTAAMGLVAAPWPTASGLTKGEPDVWQTAGRAEGEDTGGGGRNGMPGERPRSIRDMADPRVGLESSGAGVR